ncbi:MAG: hypothetical protein MUF58_11805 [Arcicella sp.]|jgi:hypothetical protein|nr:hypothetical protein [Arcicella sp.]
MKNRELLLVGLGVVLVFSSFSSDETMITDYRGNSKAPRGFRNNNPGNLKKPGGDTWQGTINYDDKGFAIFSSFLLGVRAMIIDLRTKIVRLKTVRKIISVYAPASDNNNVNQYAKTVSGWMGISPDAVLTANKSTLKSLVGAMSRFENGRNGSGWWEVTSEQFEAGFNLLPETTKQAILNA